MPITLEELQIKFIAETGALKSQLSGVQKQLTGLETSAEKAQNSLGFLKKAGSFLGGAMIGRKLINVGKDALMMANDVVESEQLFEVSMGRMEARAREWSDNIGESLGLNPYDLRKNVGMLNVMFNSMGLGEQEAYDMSTSMVQLANDMASFYNLDTEEAFTKLRAGITGETEPLKRLGILVDEQTISQYAYANGIAKTGKALTQQQKLQARYGAIMKQTQKAQGDLARTMDSPTNQLRRLNAEFDQAKIALGQALQPAMAAVIPVMTQFAVGMTHMLNGTSPTSASPFSDVVLTLAEATEAVRSAADKARSEAVEKIEEMRQGVDDSLVEYARAARKTKELYLTLSIKPKTTGYFRILEAIGSLDQYVDRATTQPIVDDMQVKLDAALADGSVTQDEVDAIIGEFEGQINVLIDIANKQKARDLKDVELQLAAGKITVDEAHKLNREIHDAYQAKIDGIGAIKNNVISELRVKDWKAKSLSQDDRERLRVAVQGEVDAGEAVIVTAQAAVSGLFGGAGTPGQAFVNYYEGLAADAHRLGQELTQSLTEGMTRPMTGEEIAALAIKRQEYAKAVKYLTTGIVEGDKLNMALFSNDMSPKGIQNVATAFTAVMKEMVAEEQTIVSDQLKMGSTRMYDPKFLASLQEKGFDSYEAWTNALQQESDRRIAALSNAFVLRTSQGLAKSAESLDLGDMGIVELKATAQTLQSFIASVDASTLQGEAKTAFDGLVEAAKRVQTAADEAVNNLPIMPAQYKTQSGQKEGLQPGVMTRWGTQPTITLPGASVVLDRPRMTVQDPLFGTGQNIQQVESNFSVSIAPLTINTAIELDGTTLGRATITAQQTVIKNTGGGGGVYVPMRE